jgi:hypothetical protein
MNIRKAAKVTVVEFVRYAMDTMPGDKDARKRIEGLRGLCMNTTRSAWL